MKVYLAYNSKTYSFKGFYLEDIHDEIPIPNICIDEDLWDSLRELTTDFKLTKDFPQKEIYTVNDLDMFITIPFKSESFKPTIMDHLEEQNAQLVMDMASKDSEIAELNQSHAQLILDSAKKDSEIEKLNQIVSELVLTVAQGGM